MVAFGIGIKTAREQLCQRVTLNSGRKSLELVTAIYESIETCKPVFMNNLKGNVKLGN